MFSQLPSRASSVLLCIGVLAGFLAAAAHAHSWAENDIRPFEARDYTMDDGLDYADGFHTRRDLKEAYVQGYLAARDVKDEPSLHRRAGYTYECQAHYCSKNGQQQSFTNHKDHKCPGSGLPGTSGMRGPVPQHNMVFIPRK